MGVEGALEPMDDDQLWMSMDPGSHIGMAFWKGRTRVRTECVHVGKLPRDVVRGTRGVARTVLDYIGPSGVLVCEDFLLRGRIGSTDREGLSPVQVTFSLLSYLDSWGWTGELVQYLPSQAISVITDARLTKYGYWDGNAHIKDATRHGLLYLRDTRSGV